MAVLSSADRARIWRGLMRYWSTQGTTVDEDKEALFVLVGDTDTWIDDNQAGYNAALTENSLTAAQKTLLFCAVALMRVDPGIALLLKRALVEEVD